MAVGVKVVLDRRERCGRPLGCDRFPEVFGHRGGCGRSGGSECCGG